MMNHRRGYFTLSWQTATATRTNVLICRDVD
jgi:hypothetical protein